MEWMVDMIGGVVEEGLQRFWEYSRQRNLTSTVANSNISTELKMKEYLQEAYKVILISYPENSNWR